MHSQIIITADFARARAKIEHECYDIMRFFEYDTLLTESAHEIMAEAAIAERFLKVIVVMARSWRIEAQNALLKILEEPPKNTSFVLIAHAKNAFLPTIRSRLPISGGGAGLPMAPTGLDFRRLDLGKIDDFIARQVALSKGDGFSSATMLGLIKSTIFEAQNAGADFKMRDYELFFKLYSLAQNYAKPAQILTPLLLLIKERMNANLQNRR